MSLVQVRAGCFRFWLRLMKYLSAGISRLKNSLVISGRKNFINMCENKVTHFSDTVYLVADDKATLFKECQCFVNKGNFSMNISDLRLTNKNGLGCSLSVLLINSNGYECDQASGSFGSVFNTNVIRSSVNAFISVALNSTTVTPDSIVITITAEGKLA